MRCFYGSGVRVVDKHTKCGCCCWAAWHFWMDRQQKTSPGIYRAARYNHPGMDSDGALGVALSIKSRLDPVAREAAEAEKKAAEDEERRAKRRAQDRARRKRKRIERETGAAQPKPERARKPLKA